MKLISHEITEDAMQLTYGDGPTVDTSKQALLIRWPHQGPLNHRVLWHQLHVLRAAQDWIDEEARRIRNELEKIN